MGRLGWAASLVFSELCCQTERERQRERQRETQRERETERVRERDLG